MDGWGARTYGQPCRGCGYSWTIPVADAQAIVAGLPAALAVDLRGARGQERIPGLAWSVTAYVAHVGDNLRIWAERLAGITAGAATAVAGYDENELATARAYDGLCLEGVMWSLGRAVGDWLDAGGAAPPGREMAHPHRGVLTLAEVGRTTAHDAAHHRHDIGRILRGGP